MIPAFFLYLSPATINAKFPTKASHQNLTFRLNFAYPSVRLLL